MQNVLRIAVTDITLDLVKASPIEPNMKPENSRAKYGRLAKIPAWAILKPKTYSFKDDFQMNKHLEKSNNR